MAHELLDHLEEIHSTELGKERICKNLGLQDADPVEWCKARIQHAQEITRRGKNWYVYAGDACITVNAASYTIITAHRLKEKPDKTETGAPAQAPLCSRPPQGTAYTAEELSEALRAIESTIRKCEKILPKMPPGGPQHTLLTRRIKALYIASDLIRREQEKERPRKE